MQGIIPQGRRVTNPRERGIERSRNVEIGASGQPVAVTPIKKSPTSQKESEALIYYKVTLILKKSD